jgi:hypothetical protein
MHCFSVIALLASYNPLLYWHDEGDVGEGDIEVGDDLAQPEGERAGTADDAQGGHAG